MYRDRIRLSSLHSKVMSAADAAGLIEDGMTVGMSGFTRAGEAKAVPHALAERAKQSPLKISLMTGASLGNDLDKQLTEAGVLARRMPFQVDSTLRKAINDGQVMFILVISLAAAEASIGLAILLQLYRRFHTLDIDAASEMRG